MNILITGTSNGIGKATALLFIDKGYNVIGIDKEDPTIHSILYKHYKLDIRNKEALPDIADVDILVNNAGTQNSNDDLGNNLIGAINITEKYAFQDHIKSVLFNASASAHTGFEFGTYSASKAGLIGYMKHCSWRLAKHYKATCNSISCGGVLTALNDDVTQDIDLWNRIMDVTPLKRWATPEEIAEWIYFLTITNKFMSGQDLLIDGGEKDLNCTFVFPGFDK